MTLLIGGFETTGGVITNVVTTLLIQRWHWKALVADPSGMPNAVKELLRYHPLSMTFPTRPSAPGHTTASARTSPGSS
ncbi:hypothetical protein [Frankia sp. QA3]|uniref:hypothetical protein n=1 Tax=Frankia sp. QA3 TaxID=710111 RepID=UPI0002E07DE7|nr:hypothetical protein [Frankia sp. QA3]